jgi:hypothetical protein
MAAKNSASDRAKGADIVRKAGYDIREEARKLQDIYLELAERAYAQDAGL